MLNLTETAIRLYRQIFGSPEFPGQLADGIETVLDGNTAVAVTEACITEVAALGSGFIEQGAALAWLSEQQRLTHNLFNEKLSVQYADSPRGALASAMGVTLSGHRSTVFLSAQELSSCQDLLQTAVGKRLPLVVHLDNRLSASQANSTGSGHDALHQVMDSGCFVLFAANVQEVVDFTLIARHVAELTMTPGIVVMDGAETAVSAQDVRLPSSELVQRFIGRSDEAIDSPSNAQKQLFSEQRKRLHRWHDLDKPVLQGAMQSNETYALGCAARATYFEELVAPVLKQAFEDFAQLTARQYTSVSTFGLKKADVVIVAQGSAIETLKTLSTYMNGLKKSNRKMNLGVIGLHSLRPFNQQALLDTLKGHSLSQPVIVLERMTVPLAGDAPLVRELRAALHNQITENSSTENVRLNEFPQLRSVIYGLGGVALNIDDLWTLCQDVKDKTNSHAKYLGVPFISYDVTPQGKNKAVSKTKEYHPKRQVMLDSLERYYPQINGLGIKAKGEKAALCSDASQSMSFAISYRSDACHNISYAMDLSATLHKLKGGYLRSTISSSWDSWSTRKTDFVTQAAQAYDLGCSSLVDYFITLSGDENALLAACRGLADKGVLIYTQSSFTSQAVLDDCQKLINDKSLTLFKVKPEQAEQPWEEILATLLGLMLNHDQLNIKTRKVVSLRESLINASSEEIRNERTELFKETLNSVIEEGDQSPANSLQISVSEGASGSFIANSLSTEESVPDIVKKLGQASESYDSLPRFWDQVGVLEQAGESDQLTADPYLATGTVPSLSASFNSMKHHRQTLNGQDSSVPTFNPQDCIACGDCWSSCPDSAISVLAITPKALIETGINMAGADAVRSVSGKLASRVAKRCRNNEIETNNAGELVSDAFDWLKEKSGLPEERLQSIENDFEKAHLAIADLPIVLTDTFFYAEEKKQNDTGELFSLIINPDSCKGCGLCVELCSSRLGSNSSEEPSNCALTLSEADPIASHYQLKQQLKIWQKTPDTSSATIERLLEDSRNSSLNTMDAGAALMMSRYNAFALSGGDQGELASGEKIAMRQLLSATEYHQQPLLYQFISELDGLRNELKKEINASLSEALPTDNLSHLAEKLSDVTTRQVDLNALLDESSQVMDTSSIDAVRTHQLVNLVLELNDLHWQLSQGTYGIGRSRYSLCITSSSIASWAGTFPHNPFHVPVTIDATGESAQLAAGLVQGQVKDTLAAMSLMRQAKAMVNPRYAKETEKLHSLDWSDLSEDEKHLCPPLFLIGGDDLLGSHGFSQVSLLLNSDYPLKVVVFNELDGGLTSGGLQEYLLSQRSASKSSDSKNNLAMMAMSQRSAYVAQTSIADKTHFQQCVHDLLKNNTAGLICVHTPSPQRHGFAPEQTIKQAELAIQSGQFPLFQYNPEKEGVFGARLTLHNTNKPVLNPVHWAINEKRFQSHFETLTVNAPSPVELSEWLQLSLADQKKKTPFVLLDGYNSKIAVSHDFANMVADQQSAWQTLLELAGIETPFTDYVEQCVAERLSDEHQADLDALRAEYEAKIAEINASHQSETHTKVRNQLLTLAGYDSSQLQKH